VVGVACPWRMAWSRAQGDLLAGRVSPKGSGSCPVALNAANAVFMMASHRVVRMLVALRTPCTTGPGMACYLVHQELKEMTACNYAVQLFGLNMVILPVRASPSPPSTSVDRPWSSEPSGRKWSRVISRRAGVFVLAEGLLIGEVLRAVLAGSSQPWPPTSP
jgi:hypothetical protein